MVTKVTMVTVQSIQPKPLAISVSDREDPLQNPAGSATMSMTEMLETFHKMPALVSYRVRCGKPTCRCVSGQRHGPYWFLHWREGSVQRRRYIRRADVPAMTALINQWQSTKVAERQHMADAMNELRDLRCWVRSLEREIVK